jgi:hypothetical protein
MQDYSSTKQSVIARERAEGLYGPRRMEDSWPRAMGVRERVPVHLGRFVPGYRDRDLFLGLRVERKDHQGLVVAVPDQRDLDPAGTPCGNVDEILHEHTIEP